MDIPATRERLKRVMRDVLPMCGDFMTQCNLLEALYNIVRHHVNTEASESAALGGPIDIAAITASKIKLTAELAAPSSAPGDTLSAEQAGVVQGLADALFSLPHDDVHAKGFEAHVRPILNTMNEARGRGANPNARSVLSVRALSPPAVVMHTAEGNQARVSFDPWIDFGVDHVSLYLYRFASQDAKAPEPVHCSLVRGSFHRRGHS